MTSRKKNRPATRPKTIGPGTVLKHHRLRERLSTRGNTSLYTSLEVTSRARGHCLVLRSKYPEARNTFEERTQLLQRLEHPGITRVIETGEHQGHLFRTTSRSIGEPLDRLLKGSLRPGTAGRIERIGSLFMQACLMIEHMHSRGVLHLALLPSTIRVDVEDRLNLDLIPAIWARDQAPRPPEPILPSLKIRAPELRGGPATAAADLFELGSLLFELLGVDGEVPYWSELRQTLIDPDPGHRPHSVSALLISMQRDAPPDQIMLPDEELDDDVTYSTEPSGVFPRPPFVGADEQLGAVREALCGSARRDNRSFQAWIGGPPGFGRSRFLHEIRETAREFGYAGLSGRCASRAGNRFHGFFGILIEAVEWLRRNFPVELERLPVPVRQSLYHYFPVYLGGEEEAGPNMLGPDEAVLALLQRLARFTGVLVTIDDIHLADSTTAEMITKLLAVGRGTPDRFPIHFACAYTTTRCFTPPAWNMDPSPPGEPRRLMLRLSTLDGAAVHRMLESIVGAKLQADSPFPLRLTLRTGGIPALIILVLHRLAREGVLPVPGFSGPRLSADPARLLEALETPSTGTRDAVLGWLTTLSSACGNLLTRLAEQPKAVPVAQLCDIAGLETTELLATLDELRSAGLVLTGMEDEQQVVAISVPLVRQALSGVVGGDMMGSLPTLEENLHDLLGPMLSISPDDTLETLWSDDDL